MDLEKSKKRKYEVGFRVEWKNKFPWLVQENSPQGKKCLICNIPIAGGLAHIQRHADCESHLRNVNRAKQTPKLQEFIENKQNIDSTAAAAHLLELRLSVFISEHNLPFTVLDHLNLLLKQSISDSKIVKKMNIDRKKAQKIINTVTAPENVKSISSFCQKNYYSIVIDESTDVSVSKNLAVVIRTYETKCIDRFLGLFSITNCTAQGIFDKIIEILKNHSIPLNNMISITADNCNVMKSCQEKFKEVVPNLFTLGCVCHNINLVSAAAFKKMPHEIDQFIRLLNFHFCNSTNRREEFKQFQEYFGTELHVILKYSGTRWLSRQSCIERVLEQWNALKYYFTLSDFEKNLGSNKLECQNTQFITSVLLSPIFKMYFLFLSYILKIINNVNIEMQAEEARTHIFLPRMAYLFRHIARNFLQKEYLDNTTISKIDVNKNHMDIDSIYCGAEVDLFICKNLLENQDIQNFKLNVKLFYMEFCKNLQTKIDFDNEILNWVTKLAPETVLSGEVTSIVPLVAKLFPLCEIHKIEEINSEYGALSEREELRALKNHSISEFWGKVRLLKNELNEPFFANIYRIAQGVLSISHSSANVERIFSIQNIIKTRCRNRLLVESVSSLIKTKDFIKARGQCCYNIQIDKRVSREQSLIVYEDENFFD